MGPEFQRHQSGSFDPLMCGVNTTACVLICFLSFFLLVSCFNLSKPQTVARWVKHVWHDYIVVRWGVCVWHDYIVARWGLCVCGSTILWQGGVGGCGCGTNILWQGGVGVGVARINLWYGGVGVGVARQILWYGGVGG